MAGFCLVPPDPGIRGSSVIIINTVRVILEPDIRMTGLVRALVTGTSRLTSLL